MSPLLEDETMLTEATGSERCVSSMTLTDLLDAYLGAPA